MNISKQETPHFLPQTLEVDERIFDKSLRIIDGGSASENENIPLMRRKDERKNLLPEPEVPAITVIPDEGKDLY